MCDRTCQDSRMQTNCSALARSLLDISRSLRFFLQSILCQVFPLYKFFLWSPRTNFPSKKVPIVVLYHSFYSSPLFPFMRKPEREKEVESETNGSPNGMGEKGPRVSFHVEERGRRMKRKEVSRSRYGGAGRSLLGLGLGLAGSGGALTETVHNISSATIRDRGRGREERGGK